MVVRPWEKAAMTKKDPEVLGRERVGQLWQVRPVQERTARAVLFFCAWLQKYHPELLRPGQGTRISI
jgi:hypothetical protein